jgi:YidC/Oxa1 family membrane protein insertase
MDKNTIIGLVLIVAIIFGFQWLNKPSEEQLAEQKRYNDSVRMAQVEEQYLEAEQQQKIDSINAQVVNNDSVKS